MEELMYFVWHQRLFELVETPSGEPLDVVHPGLRNLDAGPDFFNAKVRIDGVLWAGNVEMHRKASDWFRHHHDDDAAYDSVILHVVLENDAEVRLPNGSVLQTVVMKIPQPVLNRFQSITQGSSTTPLLPGQVPSYSCISCQARLHEVPRMIINDWLTSLSMQRLISKMDRLKDLVEGQLRGWPEAFYVALTRSLGTGVNSDAMERLARSLPLSCLLHHRDNLLQVKALLLGQAGLLQIEDAASKPAELQEEWRLMQREYAFLRNKFKLSPLPGTVWKVGRIRPPAHPEVRLRALAQLIHTHTDLLSEVMEAQNVEQLVKIFHIQGLGIQTVQSLIINAVVPTLLSYAQWQGDSERSEKAIALLDELPAEANRYIRLWQDAGIEAKSALYSQGQLQLIKTYCQLHKCMRCRIGWWLIRHDPQ